MTHVARSQLEDATRAWLEESFLRSMAGLRKRDRPVPYDLPVDPGT